ncbi:hypothetical protein OJO94_04580 [Campylobacter lari]|nr:hypothetical protein [Campylobacter lari]MCW0184367.1 hypothetical protein [Campylobacter lari]
MEKINIKLLKMRLHIEKDEKRRKEIEDILEKDDEELAKLYMEKYHKTIREKREEIANALKIKVDDVVYDKSEKFISGNRNKFEIYHKTIKHFDIYSLNEYEIDFYHCNIEFILSKGPSVYAENINFKNLYFINCKISINIVDDFCCENIHFLNCDICSLSFNKVIVKGNIKFLNSRFVNKSVFNSCIFQDSIYFNNSHFKDYVDLHACKFEKSVCFYGVTFEKTPNFSACYFKEQKAVNLTNVNIDNLDFESVEKYIEYNYKDETYKNEIENIRSEEEEIKQINNKYQLRCAKNLKDSFRVIKDVLISQNNILEAQEWHKLELYAKEKETMIKATSINDNIDSKNTTAKFLKEELYNFTEWINFILLFVYRNTSNHHTSFLKILNFTVVMIALYASLLFWLQNDSVVKSVFGFMVALAFATVIIIAFLSFIVCKNIFKLRTSRFFLFVSMGYGVFLLLCFQTLETLIVCCYILLASSISLMFFYGKYCRFFIVAFAYIVFSVVLIEKPQFINPFIGVFSSEKLHENKIEKIIQDLNSSSILNFAKISHKDFNLSWHYQDISFVELDAAKKLIMENKENILDLKEQNLTIATEFLGKKYTEISKAIKQD